MVCNIAKIVPNVDKLATNSDTKNDWLYCQDFTKFPLNHHYNPDDAFPPFLPGVSRYTPQAPRKHLVAGEDHVRRASGMGIASGLVNSTPVGKQEKGQFLEPVLLITRYQDREAV
ncbi:hypothetical protein TNCV_4488341 [Trichonephila clavipes]|nr:hypothetical protein TNCV_4488341 [Trichonephila clavipes]